MVQGRLEIQVIVAMTMKRSSPSEYNVNISKVYQRIKMNYDL